MAKEPDTFYGWWKIWALWIATAVVLVFGVILGGYGLATLFSHGSAGNSERGKNIARNHAAEAYYNLCKKQIRAGVVRPGCRP